MAVRGLGKLKANTSAYFDKRAGATEVAVAIVCAHIVVWLKADHRWQNRTGDTERSIVWDMIEATPLGVKAKVSIGGAGVWLELAHNGDWAWIVDTILAHMDEIRAIFSKALIDGSRWISNPDVLSEYEAYKAAARNLRMSARAH